jgi:hypothetical protein
MFLIFGLMFLAALLFTSLYYFVFRKLNYALNLLILLILLIVCFLPLMVPSLHTIFLAMILLSVGLFVVQISKKNREKRRT